MQSVAQYGRIAARFFFAGIHNEFQLKSPRERAREPVHLVTGVSGFSKPLSKTPTCEKWSFGDDAYFIARNKVADVLGVADGVGGWRNYGIDPSAFPRTLMEVCERLVRECRFRPQSPVNILSQSYSEVLEQKLPLVGSSTACIVALHREERTIYTANLGDSGFLVIRDGEVVHRSEEQQHYFNTPFQISVAPPDYQGRTISDSPEMAQSTSFKVEEGDVILVGTDGLFDNISEDLIVRNVTELRNHKEVEVQRTATDLAESAFRLSLDPEYISPFALSARSVGLDVTGGKPDDITVVVAKVTSSGEAEEFS